MIAIDEREDLVRALLPLVRAIARRVKSLVPSVDLDDLIGDGSIGLIRAVDSFDSQRGPSLQQYARRLVAGAMLNGIRRMDSVPERARRRVREGENERYRLAAGSGVVPTSKQMETLRPGFGRALSIAYRAQPLSLDAPLPERERLSGDWSDDPAKIVADRAATDALRSLVAVLPPRQRQVVVMHYYRRRSFREIGAQMAISAQRASQLHLAAVSRLRRECDAPAR